MAMVGAGALAPFLIRAHLTQRPLRRVTIWNHRPRSAPKLSPPSLRRKGLPVTASADLETAVREADLVSCATSRPSPS